MPSPPFLAPSVDIVNLKTKLDALKALHKDKKKIRLKMKSAKKKGLVMTDLLNQLTNMKSTEKKLMASKQPITVANLAQSQPTGLLRPSQCIKRTTLMTK